MTDLNLPSSWNLQMKYGTTPILAGIQEQIDNWRLITYLQKRDEYRAKLAIPTPKVDGHDPSPSCTNT